MPPRVYFDTNVFFDIFEGRDATLFPILEKMIRDGRVEVVVSEVNLLEFLAGNHLPAFSTGVARLFSIQPRWFYLTGLAKREVVFAFDRPRRVKSRLPLADIYDWSALLPLIVEPDALLSIPDLSIPTADALVAAYPKGSIKEREEFWQAELNEVRTAIRDELTYVKSCANILRKLVASTLQTNLGQARSLGDQILENPDLTPAFRVEVELTCHVLAVNDPRWTRNDFMDHIHAGMFGYVDFFVTRDGLGKKPGLIQKVKWFDNNVRALDGVAPYSDRLRAGFSDFAQRLP